jgi:hypothetical protein
VVIMIDISDSMFGRTGDYDYDSRKLLRVGKEQSFQAVRDEAIKLVQSLPPAARFGIVRWSGGAYSWKPELVPATDENKQAAADHIQTEIDFGKARPRGRPGGTRHDYALEETFKLKPETIYMITDGNATSNEGGASQAIPEAEIWKIAQEGQKTLAKPAKLHVIYYLTGKEKSEEERMLRGLTRAGANGSQFLRVRPPPPKAAPPPAPGTTAPPPQRTPDKKKEKRKKRD